MAIGVYGGAYMDVFGLPQTQAPLPWDCQQGVPCSIGTEASAYTRSAVFEIEGLLRLGFVRGAHS